MVWLTIILVLVLQGDEKTVAELSQDEYSCWDGDLSVGFRRTGDLGCFGGFGAGHCQKLTVKIAQLLSAFSLEEYVGILATIYFSSYIFFFQPE